MRYIEGMSDTLSAAQCRAARALLGMKQSELADASGVSARSIQHFENGERTPYPNNLAAIRRALEDAGVEFMGDEGVKLRSKE